MAPRIAIIIPLGHKLRDEFICPITRELITDPVIAADGHTYDRPAIERWLRSHETSPKTGETLEHRFLVCNINLKRLLGDMIREGGGALYCVDEEAAIVPKSAESPNNDNAGNSISNKRLPRLALVKEHILTFKCLGPVDSPFHTRTFRCTSSGVIGGRRRPTKEEDEGYRGKDFIQFNDATVSRKHFEVFYDEGEMKFYVKDLGSAGGTFIRITKGYPRVVTVGTMFMVGKHQLVALEYSADDENENENDGYGDESDTNANNSNSDNYSDKNKDGDKLSNKPTTLSLKTLALTPPNTPQISVSSASPSSYNHQTNGRPLLTLKCYAPEGTPIQGKRYYIGKNGATLGRKACNDISFSHHVDGNVVGLDSSISGEHAHLKVNGESGNVEIHDGFKVKATSAGAGVKASSSAACASASSGSTNGTWLRLSPMHKESTWHCLHHSSEVLIGTVRFHVFMEEHIVERDVYEDDLYGAGVGVGVDGESKDKDVGKDNDNEDEVGDSAGSSGVRESSSSSVRDSVRSSQDEKDRNIEIRASNASTIGTFGTEELDTDDENDENESKNDDDDGYDDNNERTNTNTNTNAQRIAIAKGGGDERLRRQVTEVNGGNASNGNSGGEEGDENDKSLNFCARNSNEDESFVDADESLRG